MKKNIDFRGWLYMGTPAVLIRRVLNNLSRLTTTLPEMIEEERKSQVLKSFLKITEDIDNLYLSIVNVSVRVRDDKYILARFKDEDGNKGIFEILRGYKYDKEGASLEKIRGFSVYLENRKSECAVVCRLIGVDYGADSACRFLWRYLNKIADRFGVEYPNVSFEKWVELGLTEEEMFC